MKNGGFLFMAQGELPKHDDLETGLDLPNADGQVGDEDITGLAGRGKRKGGQDHSLDNDLGRMPDHGVGAIQGGSDPTTDVAHIDE
jgi:hypothetical protein